MKTSNKLKIASYFLKFLMSSQIIICLGLTFVYFHSMNAPENYNSLTINTNRDIIFNFDVMKSLKHMMTGKKQISFIISIY